MKTKHFKHGKYFTTKKPQSEPCNVSNLTRQTETAFSIFNDLLFDGKVEKCAITIQESARTYGHTTINKVWQNGTPSSAYREINLTANYLKRNRFDRWGTLLHEMVHAYNLQNDIMDCNPSNQYHNKKFKTLAEKVGLVVTKEGHRGYCRTRVAQNELEGVQPVAEHAIAVINTTLGINEANFNFQRGGFIPEENTKGPIGPRGGTPTKTGKGSGSKLKKWTCGCTNVRVAVEYFDATCNSCGNDFVTKHNDNL